MPLDVLLWPQLAPAARRHHLLMTCGSLTHPNPQVRVTRPYWAVCSARVTQHGPQREGWPAVAGHIG